MKSSRTGPHRQGKERTQPGSPNLVAAEGPKRPPSSVLAQKSALPPQLPVKTKGSPCWGQVAIASQQPSEHRELMARSDVWWVFWGCKVAPKAWDQLTKDFSRKKEKQPFSAKGGSLFRFPNETSPGPKPVLDEECLLPSHPARQPLPPSFLFSELQPVRWDLSGEKSHIMQ